MGLFQLFLFIGELRLLIFKVIVYVFVLILVIMVIFGGVVFSVVLCVLVVMAMNIFLLAMLIPLFSTKYCLLYFLGFVC